MDEFDEDIIQELQKDGRAQFSALASKLGIHRNLVAQRVHHLTQTGEIRIAAAVHPRVVGLPVQASLELRIDGPTAPALRRVLELPNIVLLSEISGPAQAIVEVWAVNHDEITRAIRTVQEIPGVTEVRFALYDRILRHIRLGVDSEPPDVELDDFDIALISQLQLDGRSTFGQLARLTGRSPSACRARVLRLTASDVVRVGAVRNRLSVTGSMLFGIGLFLSGDPAGRAAAEQLLVQTPLLEFAARVLGRYDLLATVSVRSITEYNEIMHTLRAHPCIRRVESWIHASIWTERYQWSAEQLAASRR